MVCQQRQFTSKRWRWSLVVAVLLALSTSTAFAQEVRPVVSELVDEALGQNLTLQQQTLRLEQSRSRLAEARGAFSRRWTCRLATPVLRADAPSTFPSAIC